MISQFERLGPPMILRIEDVEYYVGVSRKTIYRLVKAKQFPAQKIVSNGARGWLYNDVAEWVISRPAANEIEC